MFMGLLCHTSSTIDLWACLYWAFFKIICEGYKYTDHILAPIAKETLDLTTLMHATMCFDTIFGGDTTLESLQLISLIIYRDTT